MIFFNLYIFYFLLIRLFGAAPFFIVIAELHFNKNNAANLGSQKSNYNHQKVVI